MEITKRCEGCRCSNCRWKGTDNLAESDDKGMTKRKSLLWKIWGGHRKEYDAIYLWSPCMDDALYVARLIDPDLCIAQWTGGDVKIIILLSYRQDGEKEG